MKDPNAIHRRSVRRRGLVLLGLVCLIPLVGFSYQAIGSALDAQNYPPPGRLVDVSGYRLHLYCTGEGAPTVVLDSGLGGSWLDWSRVQPALEKTTHVCSYDRAGLGWSDVGPEPRDAQHAVEELHALLQNAGVAGPLIFVGHSNGGLRAQLYAALYPNDVVGMVLVDPTITQSTNEQLAALPAETRAHINALLHESGQPTEAPTPDQNLGMQVLAALAPFGVMRLIGGGLLELSGSLPIEAVEPYRAVAMRTPYVATVLAESRQIHQSIQQVRAQPANLGDMPLVVLLNAVSPPRDDATIGQAEQELQRLTAPLVQSAGEALAARSSRGQLVMVEGSGHYIQIDQPETVIRSIERVIEETRG
ncbi:MAG TPA: alpha/beta hydrolase [Candidatus Limnocylindrales bacterium]|nr:alpha/beta hydrolase [Candidatus Limnocylindrales bacterium]